MIPLSHWLIKSPQLGLALVIFSVVPGNLIRLSLGTQARGGAAILLSDILIPVLVISWLLRKLVTEREVKQNIVNAPLLIFSFIALASLIQGLGILNVTGDLTLKEAIVSSMYWFRWIEYAFLFFVAADLM